MSYLADTHILIWSWQSPDRLSDFQRRVLNSEATVYFSMASLWEISIKASVGKLILEGDVARNAVRTGYTILPITIEDTAAVKALPILHRDPFDRMLIVQAQARGLRLLTSDDAIKQYDVQTG